MEIDVHHVAKYQKKSKQNRDKNVLIDPRKMYEYHTE